MKETNTKRMRNCKNTQPTKQSYETPKVCDTQEIVICTHSYTFNYLLKFVNQQNSQLRAECLKSAAKVSKVLLCQNLSFCSKVSLLFIYWRSWLFLEAEID